MKDGGNSLAGPRSRDRTIVFFIFVFNLKKKKIQTRNDPRIKTLKNTKQTHFNTENYKKKLLENSVKLGTTSFFRSDSVLKKNSVTQSRTSIGYVQQRPETRSNSITCQWNHRNEENSAKPGNKKLGKDLLFLSPVREVPRRETQQKKLRKTTRTEQAVAQPVRGRRFTASTVADVDVVGRRQDDWAPRRATSVTDKSTDNNLSQPESRLAVSSSFFFFRHPRPTHSLSLSLSVRVLGTEKKNQNRQDSKTRARCNVK